MRFLFFLVFLLFGVKFLPQTSAFNSHLAFALDNKLSNDQKFDLLVEGPVSQLHSNKDLQILYKLNSIASVRCNAQTLSQLLKDGQITRAELIPAKKIPLYDTMVYRNRLEGVKNWTSPLPQAYDGSGILMGIIDTGIDFSHPDFKDSLGNTRIQFLWDQKLANNFSTPQPYNYGQEWTANEIDLNLCAHSDFQYYGHGTGVSGIASGNANATGQFEGVAPKCDLIIVALDFNKIGPTIADAVHYIISKATLLNKPFVINASLGSYYGSHDGTDSEAKSIDAMIADIPGRVMVAAAGNAGNIPFHSNTQLQNNDTAFTWINSASLQFEHSLYGDLNQIQQLKFSIGATRNNYSYLGNIGFKPYNYSLNSIQTDTLKHNNNRIGIIKSIATINSYNVLELSFQITADTANLLWSVESTGSGIYDAWDFDFVSSPLPSVAQFPRILMYVKPDTVMNMVSSFQCSDEIITVANYVNTRDYRAFNNNIVNTSEIAGNLAVESSSGPTRDLRQKPDISATGNNLTAPMCLFYQNFYLQNVPQIVAEGSMHIQSGGTSAASPVVAGLAALYLQKNPNATNREIKNAIRNCAYQDNFTANNLPHIRWGFGKLDAKATMLCNETIVLGVKPNQNQKEIKIYPNPFSDELNLQIPNSKFETQLRLYTVTGELLLEQKLIGDTYKLQINEALKNYIGFILLQLVSAEQTISTKLIKY